MLKDGRVAIKVHNKNDNIICVEKMKDCQLSMFLKTWLYQKFFFQGAWQSYQRNFALKNE